jgi:hypothetical protein
LGFRSLRQIVRRLLAGGLDVIRIPIELRACSNGTKFSQFDAETG